MCPFEVFSMASRWPATRRAFTRRLLPLSLAATSWLLPASTSPSAWPTCRRRPCAESPCGAYSIRARKRMRRLEPLQPTADDDIRRCAEVARLRQHNATLDGVTRAARDQTVMPSELRAQVHTMHIWPADAVVDLEDGGGSVTTTRPRDRVCMVSVAGATEADGCASPMG